MTAVANDFDNNAEGGITSKNSVVQFDRANTATAYAAGDVISDQASIDTGANALQFKNVGKGGRLDHAMVCMEEDDTANLELWVFDSEPTGQVDNVALALVAADMAKLVCVYSFADAAKKSGGGFQAYVATLDTEGANIKRYCCAAGETLWGLLVTRSAFTPTASGQFTVSLEVQAD